MIDEQYEKASTLFTLKKTICQYNGVFANIAIASAIIDALPASGLRSAQDRQNQ